MKRIALFAGVLAIAASCSVKEMEMAIVPAPSMYGYTEEDQAAKTAITVDGEGVGTIWWKPADNINVFFGTTSVRYYSTNAVDATTVVFETNTMLGSTESASDNKWGLYPYNSDATSDGVSVTTTIPSAQQCVPETFGNNLFPMLAHTSTNELHFKNVCGGIKFSLSRNDIKSITFSGNNNENIVGQVKLSLDGENNPVATVVAGEKTITLTPSTGTTFASGTNYYLVMLPTVLTGGFTMTFETETELGTFAYTTKSVEIKRSIFAKKANIDTYATFVPKGSPSIAGALSGEFSVSATKKVHFSKGNLQATYNGTDYTWGFAENQYDYIGHAGGNRTIGNQTSGKVVDTFGWSTSATNYGINVSTENADYIGDFVDWGKIIGDGNTWRTLSKDEWVYLFNTRNVNGGTGKNNSYSNNITHGGKRGLVLYPDNYTGITLSGTVTTLPDGVVFLPAAGYRNYSSVYNDVNQAHYWSSTTVDDYSAYGLYFNTSSDYVTPDSSEPRAVGFSVRLVTDAN